MVLLDQLTFEVLVPAQLSEHVADQLRAVFRTLSEHAARNVEAQLRRIADAAIVIADE